MTACAVEAVLAGVTELEPWSLAGLSYCGLNTRVPGSYNITYQLVTPRGTLLVVTRYERRPACSARRPYWDSSSAAHAS